MKISTAIVVGTLVSGLATAAMSQSESVVYSFKRGYAPGGKMLVDTYGDLVGAAATGPGRSGSVYRLREKLGHWREDTTYKFGTGGDGSDPQSGLAQDANGVYYGTTYRGGNYGNGTVYSLTANGGGWSENILYSFSGGSDGGLPLSKLLYDKATGAFYGTTSDYGRYNCGTVYQLAESGGRWTLTTLYTFQGGSADGCYPETGLHLGASNGTIVGTTYAGSGGYGTVFELKEHAGTWSEKILYAFKGGADGANPYDIDVNLQNNMAYGVTNIGGAYNGGVVYSLNLVGHPVETVLHSFTGGGDGLNPTGLHLESSTGKLFGVSLYGGRYSEGTIFELVQTGKYWNESVLYSFGSHSGDGAYPMTPPAEDKDTGTLYGTTSYGGQYGDGAVWSLTQ